MLRRETFEHSPWPRRVATGTGIALGGIAALVVLANGLARIDPAHTRDRRVAPAPLLPLACPEVVAAPTPPAPAPPPPPPPIAEPEPEPEPPLSCPEPDPVRDSAAGKPLARFLPLDQYADDYQPAIGITASPTRHGLLAVWSRHKIWLSLDDGKSFAAVLDGPGAVADVTIDCRDRLVAVRGEPQREESEQPGRARLGIRDAAGDERWRELPAGFPLSIAPDDGRWRPSGPIVAASPSWIGVVTEIADGDVLTRIGLTGDDGATWKYLDLGELSDIDKQLHIAADGSLRAAMAWSDCSWEGVELYTGDADTTSITHLAPPERRPSYSARFGADGWLYSAEYDGCGKRTGEDSLCALAPNSKRWRRVRKISDQTFPPLQLADNGRVTLAVVDLELLRLHRGRLAATLARDVPELLDRLAVDSDGRALGLISGHLVRHSPRHGWRLLWGPALRD